MSQNQQIAKALAAATDTAALEIVLTLCDVSSQVWNWMCDIIVWHCQDWNLCD